MEAIKKYKKEKKKEKKRIKREQREQEEKLYPKKPEEIEGAKVKPNINVPFKTRKELKEEFKQKCKNGMRVIIDCDFEHLMNERGNKTLKSMCCKYICCDDVRDDGGFPRCLVFTRRCIHET